MIFMALAILAFVLFVYLIQSYSNDAMSTARQADEEWSRVYDYQYELIIDSRNATFWQEVYDHAKEAAGENNALVSVMKAGWFDNYDKLDYVDMCIAAQVDGIILEYNGENGLQEKIDEAVSKGIPVVTIVNDAPRSNRQSFVGVNDYQMGQMYGDLVADLVDDQTKEILIVSNREEALERNQMYAQIYNAVFSKVEDNTRIHVQERNLISKSQFDVEDSIRSIFQDKENSPQILVCLDEVTTECAYQAMIDYNMVGQINIIGFYTSDMILDAVQRGLIPATVCMDAGQIGMNSVEALTEYQEIGRNNAYYTVDLQCVSADNWKEWQEDRNEN